MSLTAILTAAAGIALFALVASRLSSPPQAFSFDQYEQERRQKAPLIERSRVQLDTDVRVVHD